VSTSSEGERVSPYATRPGEQETLAGLATNGKAAALPLGLFDGSRELLQVLPVAVYTTDAEGRITAFNEAAAALWGRRPELGKTKYSGFDKLYSPDGTLVPHDESPMALALKQERPIRGVEVVAERPDGTRVPFVPYPTPLFDAAGAVIGAVNIVVDISARKRAEAVQAALHEFTDRLYRSKSASDVYESALDAIASALGCQRASILLMDDAGTMRFVAWRRLSDTYRRAVEGHSPWTRDAKDPQLLCIEDIETADFPDSLKATVRAEGIEALAFIPLVSNGELVGKFMTYYDAPHVFSDVERDLALTIARHLGLSIERMRAG